MTLTNQNYPTWLHGLWACGAVLLLALAGCGGGETASDSGAGKLHVVATTTILEDVVRQLAGNDADVTGVMRVGEDPHIYQVRPMDAVLMQEADLVLANGLHLEATLGGVIQQVASDHAVELAEVAGIEPLGTEAYQGAPDPHIWMDVTLMSRIVEAARDALVEADPDHAEGYQQRAEAYLKQLAELDAWVREQWRSIPEQQRVIVTSHDAFNYYAKAYGVEVHGVVGISTDQQPTTQDIEALRNLVSDRGVKALFIENSTSPTLNNIVTRIANDSGAKIGGTLLSDSLGDPGTPGEHYIGMIRHNTRTMVEALR